MFFSFKGGRQPPIRHLSDFVGIIQTLNPKGVDNVAYRGHASVKWSTDTLLFRNDLYKSENAIFRTLITLQPESFQNDSTMLDRLVRMQHFSLPTRLLDVTWNPLVALYFCVKSHPVEDGHVLTIGFKKEDDKFFDSDTISCLTNLVNMTATERDTLGTLLTAKISEFNDHSITKRLLHFIKAEKPYFLPIINPFDLRGPRLVRPKLSNKRIVAQNGAFIVFGLETENLEKRKNFSIQKLTIEAKDKAPLTKELDAFGFNGATMFPELEKASEYIAKKFGSKPS